MNNRRNAHFDVSGRSGVKGLGHFGWKVTVSLKGIEAVRSHDRRRMFIDWKTFLGTCMFHGLDSERKVS